MLRHSHLALALQFFLRAEAEIGFALGQQPLGMFTIEIEPVTLAIRHIRPTHIRSFVPTDAKPPEVIEQLRFVSRFASLQIGVFNAQDHRAAGLACKEPVVKRRAGIANVELASGGGCKTNANFRRWGHLLMLAKLMRLCGVSNDRLSL